MTNQIFDKKTVSVAIPGPQGPGGEITEVTAEALPTGAEPTVTLGGTPEKREIHLGLPRGGKGDPGDGSVNSVNGDLGPDITLGASDVGAVAAVNGKSGTEVMLSHSDVGAARWISFNIMDFGAVGDGVEDDKNALQAALDAAHAAGNASLGLRGEVIVPPGKKYLIGAQTIIRANTILTLYGAELVKPVGASFPWFRNFQTGQDSFPGYTGNGNIIVRGGTFNGQSHTGPNPAGNNMCFEHAENIEVRDVTFLNTGSGQVHALEFNAIKGGRVINCRFLGFNSYDKIAEAIQLDIAVPGSGNLPPADETTCDDILVQGCIADKSEEAGYWGALVGSHMARPGKRYTNIRVIDNIVFGSLHSGVRMHQWQDSLVSGNLIIGAPEAGVLCEVGSGANATGSNRNQIRGNTIRDCGNGILIAGTADAYFREMIVSGNIIRDSGTDGINALRVQQLVISGNTVTNSGEDGIQVHNSNYCAVSDNQVRGAGRYCVLGSPSLSDSRIQNNSALGAGTLPVRVSTTSHRNIISGNQVRGDSSMFGISVGTGCEDNMVYGNDMFGTKGLENTGTRTDTSSNNR